MQLFVRDASTVVVEASGTTTVHELKELWTHKAFGVVSTVSWVSWLAAESRTGRGGPAGDSSWHPRRSRRRSAPDVPGAFSRAAAGRHAAPRRARGMRSVLLCFACMCVWQTARAWFSLSQALVHEGRALPNAATLSEAGLRDGASLCARLRLRGGGGDGGSTGAESRSCYLEMYQVGGRQLPHLLQLPCMLQAPAHALAVRGFCSSGALRDDCLLSACYWEALLACVVFSLVSCGTQQPCACLPAPSRTPPGAGSTRRARWRPQTSRRRPPPPGPIAGLRRSAPTPHLCGP